MSDCGCVAYHTAAAEMLKGLGDRYAMVATHCGTCGMSYRSFLDPNVMADVDDVISATRTKRCGEGELREIVDGMVGRAASTGIGRGRIDVIVKRHGAPQGESGCMTAAIVLLILPLCYFANRFLS